MPKTYCTAIVRINGVIYQCEMLLNSNGDHAPYAHTHVGAGAIWCSHDEAQAVRQPQAVAVKPKRKPRPRKRGPITEAEWDEWHRRRKALR